VAVRRGAGRSRGRVALAYGLLLVVTAALATVAVREVLLLRMEERITSALDQEVAEFNRFLLVTADPTGGGGTLAQAFDTYLSRNVPSREEAFVAVLDGELYGAALSRFPLDGLPTAVLDRFTGAGAVAPPDDAPSGSFATAQGTGWFRSLPVQLAGASGAFVVLVVPVGEYAEIREMQVYGGVAVVLVLLVAAAGAWLVVRRLLGPVELLTETAEQISRSDLERRIDVRGTGQAADMARTFNAMLDRIERVVRSEREFVRDASHELRVPVTVCMGNLEVLGMELGPDGEHRATIGLVTDELSRMGRIVDDLRLLADVGLGEFLQPEAVDLAGLRDDMLAKARVLADRRWLAEGDPHGVLLADRHRLTEALMNLADNAVRHTGEGDEIAVGAAVTDGEVALWVRDSGPGVAPTDQARIFDRFRRGSGAYRHYRGSGLGLSIVKVIAEAHGGRVVLDSAPGEGATFTLRLPHRPLTPLSPPDGTVGAPDHKQPFTFH
jgi:two-component system, OmpR family, sensor kinase